MKPYAEAGGITLYHGDCRDVCDHIPADTVDLLLSDAPYGQQFTGQSEITKRANIRGDGARQGVRLVRQMLFNSDRLMRSDAHLLLFCHWESWPDFYDAASSTWPIKNALIWWKNRGGVGDTELEYARDYEVILYGARGRRKLLGRRPCAVLVGHPPVGTDRLHPTEKPEPLLRQLIERHSPEGGTVLDPFCGVGSALVAAKRVGRKGIGIEIEERYCEAAAKRLLQDVLPMGAG